MTNDAGLVGMSARTLMKLLVDADPEAQVQIRFIPAVGDSGEDPGHPVGQVSIENDAVAARQTVVIEAMPYLPNDGDS